jgi:hypothetical protein
MDHHALPERLAGVGCTSCGTAIPVDRIAVLADRGDLAFVELSCPACGSQTLGVVVATGADPADTVLDTAAHPELDPATEGRLAGRPALAEEDVLAMRRFLATWEGDLRSLLQRPGGASDAGTPR